MSLIICPECNKSVSEFAKVCIHCGFPLGTQKDNICIINGNEFDLSEAIQFIGNNSHFESIGLLSRIAIIIQNITNMDYKSCVNLSQIIIKNGKIPPSYNANNGKEQKDAPHCPHCNSTSISTNARGVNWKLGLIGASKTVNRCASCGWTWDPATGKRI